MPRSAWEALAELLSSAAQQPEEKEEEEEDLPAPVTAVTVTEEGGGQAAVSEQGEPAFHEPCILSERTAPRCWGREEP